MRADPDVVLFDVDGTLVDSNYQNAIAWYRAFRSVGVVVPIWQVHRHLGMGGDLLVAAVAGEDVDKRVGDEVRVAWEREMEPLIDEISPVDGAAELLEACASAGFQVVLASSGKAEHVEHYLDLVGARPWVHAWTSSADVSRTKPHPDIVQAARARTDGGSATMVGDSPWDVEAGRRAGIATVTVLTGGFGRDELQDAGAAHVVEHLRELTDDLDLLRVPKN